MTKVQLIEKIKHIDPKLSYGVLWTSKKKYLEDKLEILEERYANNLAEQ